MKPQSPRQLEALRIVAEGRFYPTFVREEDGWHARWRAISADNSWVDEYVRSAVVTCLSEDAEDQRHETLHDAWLMALKSRTGLVRWDDAECARFADEIRNWNSSVADDTASRENLAFDFQSIPGAKGDESFRISCPAPHGFAEYRLLGEAAHVSALLTGLRRRKGSRPSSRNRLELVLTRGEAERFVRTEAPHLRAAGFTVVGDCCKGDIAMEAVIETPSTAPTNGAIAKLESQLRLTVTVAGEPVTAEELRFLLDQGSSIVYFRDHWIEIDRALLRQALRALERDGGTVSSPLSFALGLGRVGAFEISELRVHGWLRGLVNSLRSRGERVKPVKVPKSFCGTLRDYQRRGVTWMKFLTDHGFGALLADEMGLGKTIQTIAWILSLMRAKDSPPTLIVAPLTLLVNWQREFSRFAPSLRIYAHYGDDRSRGPGFRREAREADVVLTSYNLLTHDYSDFSETEWGAMVLDEAQIIKNPDTAIAKAVRALMPRQRLALTGTPIENSVGDIWSIEEFLNPGFLGDRKDFNERFRRPMALDPNCAAGRRLKYSLEPFVLRRLKSEPGVAEELGPKREIREYCSLSDIQRRAYETELSHFRFTEHSRGEIFALLTRLKLICDGFDETGKSPLSSPSGNGKLARLVELISQIFEAGESVLVFTQYAKVGAWLQRRLQEAFGQEFPYLHGALDVAARERQVERFNSMKGPSAFVLSLKAGGFGLNLTKASHVIHYDRWWNPAVESQATDRVHRIGQSRTVFVHEFITSGTMEERVSDILERKLSLRQVLSDGEKFIRMVSLDV